MYIKILGFILTVTGGIMLGIKRAKTLSDREEMIISLKESLIHFQNEIEFKTEMLQSALRKASATDKSGVFMESAESIGKYGAVNGFLFSAEKIRDKQVREILFSFGRGLDAEDKAGQIKNVQLALERVGALEKIASEEKRKLSKMYVMTSFLISAAVGIMFI